MGRMASTQRGSSSRKGDRTKKIAIKTPALVRNPKGTKRRNVGLAALAPVARRERPELRRSPAEAQQRLKDPAPQAGEVPIKFAKLLIFDQHSLPIHRACLS